MIAGREIPDLTTVPAAAAGRVEKVYFADTADACLQRPDEVRDIMGYGVDSAQSGDDNAIFFIHPNTIPKIFWPFSEVIRLDIFFIFLRVRLKWGAVKSQVIYHVGG